RRHSLATNGFGRSERRGDAMLSRPGPSQGCIPMDEKSAFAGSYSNYVFDQHTGERDRLRYQFALLREDFNRWFDEALKLGGLTTDPAQATWSVLDVGCGEGFYTREVARRYPNARVVGVDTDTDAIAAATAASVAAGNIRF